MRIPKYKYFHTFQSFQSLCFLNAETLAGKKLKIYVLIKILKFCTGSSAKSYQCKGRRQTDKTFPESV